LAGKFKRKGGVMRNAVSRFALENETASRKLVHN
jgi:hypothetical protein